MRKLITVLVLLTTLTSLSQDSLNVTHTFESTAFEKERTVYVHLPEAYFERPDTEFGVVYVLDAQAPAFFNNVKDNIDYLVWSYQVMPLIVVGIHSDDRGKEFIPLDRQLTDDDPDNYGTAHLLSQHFEQEVFPLIANQYRVNSFRAIIGHSRGGAFIANTIFSDQRDMFNAYLAISPGMRYLDGQLLADAEKWISQGTDFHSFYYCSHGTVGTLEHENAKSVSHLDSLWNAHENSTIDWQTQSMEGTSHWGVVAPSVTYGILAMSRAYQVDQYLIETFCENDDMLMEEQINAYYARQQNRLGYTLPLHAADLRYYAGDLAEEENYNRGLELINMAIGLDSKNMNGYFSKGWMLQQMGRTEDARENYKAALLVLKGQESDLPQKKFESYQSEIEKQLKKLE
ncbi:MAG: hypothetical protein KDC12_15560 [Flavobacteriales bacterium]|nr:hypothetical protein [Flavobacteriales bacterium]